jgi:hypothetical protein
MENKLLEFIFQILQLLLVHDDGIEVVKQVLANLLERHLGKHHHEERIIVSVYKSHDEQRQIKIEEVELEQH